MAVAVLAWCVRPAVAGDDAGEEGYHLAGRIPLGAAQRSELDRLAPYIRVGIDTDKIRRQGFSPTHYVEAVLTLAREVRAGSMPGAVLLVDRGQSEIAPVAVGWQLTDPEVHETDWSTLYEVGDLVGPLALTPLALMALEEGRLKLDVPLKTYCLEFSGSAVGDILIEDLLRHSSGLPRALEVPGDVRDRRSLVRVVRELEPRDRPEKRVVPSGVNFLLLGLVLESIYGEPAKSKAVRDLLEPVGMMNTAYKVPVDWRARTAPGSYSPWHGRLAWAESDDPSAYILGASAGHGGLVTSADDLALYAQLMVHACRSGLGDGLSTQTLSLALSGDPGVAGGEKMGLGWMLDGFGPGSVGWESSTGTSFWVQPETGVYAIILTNANHPKPREVDHGEIRRRALKWMEHGVREAGKGKKRRTGSPGEV